MKTRLIQDGVPLHVYNKGYDGNLLFYTIFDYLSFFTALSCLSAKYGVELIALTLMPNHFHCLQLGERKAIIKFNQDLASWYAREFNSVYNINGQLFSTPYGRAPKSIGKQIRATIAYILNNPCVGGISDSILEYRWNFIPYYGNPYPFSEAYAASKASMKMRRAVQHIKRLQQLNHPLNHANLRILFSDLTRIEAEQLIDIIIVEYQCVNFKKLSTYFNSDLNRIFELLNTTSGSEHDIKEDWERYDCYLKLIDHLKMIWGNDFEGQLFKPGDRTSIEAELVRRFRAKPHHLDRVFHKPRFGRGG